jgi:hypothetical protein
MTPEQWHRVKEVFEAAIDQAPGERSAFVGQVCAGDELLRNEVNSLLSSYQQESSFLETPAAAVRADFEDCSSLPVVCFQVRLGLAQGIDFSGCFSRSSSRASSRFFVIPQRLIGVDPIVAIKFCEY